MDIIRTIEETCKRNKVHAKIERQFIDLIDVENRLTTEWVSEASSLSSNNGWTNQQS